MNETFAELGYNVGDTVRCVDDRGRRFYKTGKKYVLESIGGRGPTIKGDHNGLSAAWELVSRAGSTDAVDEYPIWRDMTPEAQGALLLAHHTGDIIQFFSYDEWLDIQDPNFARRDKYRVKPANPVVVTHEISGSDKLLWGFNRADCDTHKITYNTIDGVIDCASVKMIELPK